MSKFFWLVERVLLVVIFVLTFPLIIYSKFCFSDGICRKCSSGKIILKSYDSDRPYQIYGCTKCNYKYSSVSEHKEITDSELKLRLRKLKFNKVCSANIAQRNQVS